MWELQTIAELGAEKPLWESYHLTAEGIVFKTPRGEVLVPFDTDKYFPYPRQAVRAPNGVLYVTAGQWGSAKPEVVLGSDGSRTELDLSKLTGQDEPEGHIVAAAVLKRWGVRILLLSDCLCVFPSGGSGPPVVGPAGDSEPLVAFGRDREPPVVGPAGGGKPLIVETVDSEPLVIAQFDPKLMKKLLEPTGHALMGVEAWALKGTPKTGVHDMTFGFHFAWGDGQGSTFMVVHSGSAVEVQHVLNNGDLLGAADGEPRDAAAMFARAESAVAETSDRLTEVLLVVRDYKAGLAQGAPLPPALEEDLREARRRHFEALADVDTAVRAQVRSGMGEAE